MNKKIEKKNYYYRSLDDVYLAFTSLVFLTFHVKYIYNEGFVKKTNWKKDTSL